MRLLAVTRSGIAAVEDGRVELVWRGEARCLARSGAGVFAGTEGAGVLRSDDGGGTWMVVGLGGTRARSIAAAGDRVLVGTQPAAVQLSHDGGESWRRVESFPRRRYWLQPATPPYRQGYVSALAVEGDLVLAGIEAFKGFRSVDGGATWHPLRRGFARDCHVLVLAHGRAYEGAGLGPAWSMDGGATWKAPRRGLDRRYVMSAAVDPADADCWYVAAAPILKAHTPDARAAVYRWSDREWTRVTDEMRALPHALLCPAPDVVVAGLRDGTLLVSTDRGATWDEAAAIDGVHALA
jgi:photosystem II stability/assembly factor-like uncharacterized protein